MKKLFLMAAAAALMVQTALAEEIDVVVKGMVCSFCAQGIQNKFKELDSVESLNVDLKTKILSLKLKEGKTLTDKEIKQNVKDSGYDLEKITRRQ